MSIRVDVPAAIRGRDGAKRKRLATEVGQAVRSVLQGAEHHEVRTDLSWCSLHFCSLSEESFTIRLWDRHEGGLT